MAAGIPENEPRVNVVAPDGTRGTIPASGLEAAKNAGYDVLTDAQVTKARRKEAYGDSEFAAGAAGLARGATLGLSDVALTKTGLVNPETLSGLKEENPLVSTASEVGGNLLPFLVPGGAEVKAGQVAVEAGVAAKAAAAAAKLAPARLASELGHGGAKIAEKAAASILGDASTGIAESAVRRGLTTGFGSALEGAAYGAGTAISEDALGDKELTAESLLTHVGLGALFGGVVGGGMGAVSGRGGRKLATTLDEAAPNDFAVAADEAAVAARGEGNAADTVDAVAAGTSPGDKTIADVVDGQGAKSQSASEAILEKALGEKPADGLTKALQPIIDGQIGRRLQKQLGSLTGVPKEAVRDLMLSAESRAASTEAQAVKNDAIPALTDAFNKVHAATDMVQEQAKGVLKFNRIKQLVKTGNEADVAAAAQQTIANLRGKIDDMLRDVHRYGNKNALVEAKHAIDVYGGDIRRAIGGDSLDAASSKAAKEFGGATAATQSADHNALIFDALDKLKRKIGSKKLAKFGQYNSSADNATALHLQDMYEQELMPMLENTNLWGKGAELQIAVNKPWTNHLQQHGIFQHNFFRDIGRNTKGLMQDADTQKIGAFLDNLGDPRNSTANKQLQTWLDSTSDLMSAVHDHYAFEGRSSKEVMDALQAVKDIRATMGKVENTVVKANQLREITKAAPFIGHALIRLTAIERATQGVGKRIGNSIKEFVAGEGARTSKIVGAIRESGKEVGDRLERSGEKVADTVSESVRSGVKDIINDNKQRSDTMRRTVAKDHHAVPTDDRGRIIHPFVGASSTLFGSLESRTHYREHGDSDRIGRYKAQVRGLQKAVAYPAQTQAQIASNLAPLQQDAPQVAIHMSVKGNQALQFLYGKIAPGLPNPTMPALMNAYRPMDDEVTSFERYARVLNDPMTAVDDLKARRLTSEAVDGLKNVYPKLYAQIVQQAAQAVSSTDRPMGYRDRIQLSLLLGSPLDPTLDPGYLNLVASAGGQPTQPGDAPQPGPAAAPGKMRMTGLKDTSRSTNLATASQRLEGDA